MRSFSILENIKVRDIKISLEKYFKLSTSEKSDYVATLIRSFQEDLKYHTEELERYFKKNPVNVSELEIIESEFALWVELIYETLSPLINEKYLHEVFFLGPGIDDLITSYSDPEKQNWPIPTDELLKYVARMREYAKVTPLKNSVLKKLTTNPLSVLSFEDDELQEDEFQEKKDGASAEVFSEGVVMVSGQRIELSYPFYTIVKYLERKNAFSEQCSLSQRQIHEDLKLPFKEPRLKQWKKIKGRTNPVIAQIFRSNTRGYFWLKKNVRAI